MSLEKIVNIDIANICFITAIYGGYEKNCKKFIKQTIETDFICFTDNNDIINNGWIIDTNPYHITNKSNLDDNTYTNSLCNNKHTFNIAKYYKQSFSNIPILQKYDIIVWIDGTIEIIYNKTSEYILNNIYKEKIIGWHHEYRYGILKNEMEDSLINKYTSKYWNGQSQPYQDVSNQYKSYLDDGYKEDFFKNINAHTPHMGVWITCFIAFLHKDNEIKKFLDLWYLQTLKYTTQDQIGFPYTCQKTNIIPHTLPNNDIFGDCPHHNTLFYIKHWHNGSPPINQSKTNCSLCLNMIVKNERHIIRETLDNLTNYIKFSYWVISDTGSTDGTQEFIKEYFREKNIPGELFEDEWQDFAHNRNIAMEHAFDKSDYLFFFDADDLIHGDFKFPDKLDKDTYKFKFGTGFTYDRICLINNREKIAKYVGVLHELLHVYKPNFTNEMVNGEYHFESRNLGDRSKNPDKYKNDAEVLEKAFHNENTDLGLKYRYAYYCAQSYRDAHLIEKSTEWFKLFLDLPAGNQYKYCACNNLGDNYKKLNNMEEAVNYWYKAIPFDRERRESVVKIMEYYFNKSNHFAVNMLYERMKNYKLTNPDGKIFLDMTRYHDIDYFNSISSCNIGEWMSGYYSCKNLLLNDKWTEITLQNFTCYGYNMHLDQDKQPFIDKLLELFEKYFDSKKELVKKLWNMVSKHIKGYLPEQIDEINKENIIFKAKKNYCFIHSCNIKETGTKTLDYLIDKINKSGLINNLDKIFINNIGIPIENVYGDKFEINNYSKDINLFELPTINIIHDFSEINSDCNILYLHTKGISHINNLLTQQNNIKNWVDMMLYFLVENFELCVDKLNNNDAVGCNYYTTTDEAYHLACGDQVFLAFSGNFWWSKSNFIKTLPKLDITENINKYDAELWLCKNNPKVHVLHNSHVNHYLQNYTRERYVIKKFSASKEYQFNKLYDKYNERENDFQHKIPLDESSNKILIFAGFHNNLWNGTLVDKENFCGGSQKAVAYLARYLPKNYEIFVSGDVKDEVIDNITYVNRFNLQPLLDKEKFHTIIVSRYVSFFLLFPKFKCYQLYLTAHDFEYINMLEGSNILPKTIIENNNDIIDGAVCLTNFHKNNTEILYPILKDKLDTINNGINPQDFKFDCNRKIKNKFSWTSCNDRGFDNLLIIWPKILEKIPDATLDICSYKEYPQKILDTIKLYNSITYHGKLNTEELYKLISTSEYWLFTNKNMETSCITGLEMLMSEVICLYYPVGGLVDTIGDYGIKVEGGNEIDTILNLSEERKTELRKNGKEYALTCSWENRAKEWSKLLGLQNLLYTVDNYDNQQSIKFLTYPPNKCIISELISKNQVWEPHMHRIFEKYINKESIVIEGGCHIGTHTLKLALLGKQVLSFEPLHKSNEILYNNIKINNIDNVTLYSEGLSNVPGEAYFETIQINNPGAAGLSNNPMGKPNMYNKYCGKYPVKLITIDSLELNKLDFIKLDVEGYEINVIEGAINTIKRCKPIITLESWKNHFGEVCLQHTKNTFKILFDNGYSMQHIAGPDFLFLPLNKFM